MKKLIAIRKHAGEEYKFYLSTFVSWVDEKEFTSIGVEGPKNCFGYPNRIIYNRNAYGVLVYGATRYIPNWIGERLLRQVERFAIKYQTKEAAK